MPDAIIFLAPHLGLLFVVLPLHDQAQVLLLKVCKVLIEVLWILKGQIVGVI